MAKILRLYYESRMIDYRGDLILYKMLIVDDEYLVRMGIKETISWKDYEIEIVGEATNGQEGLEQVKKQKPDIIISDIKMPLMDGLEFVKQVKGLKIDCEIIILSGYKDFEYAKNTLENGAYSYLLKPIDNDELVTTVKKSLAVLKEKREKVNYYSHIEEELPLIRKKIISDLISNNYSGSEEIEEKINLYRIPISKQGYVVFGQIDYPENIEEKEKSKMVIQVLRDSIVAVLKEEKAANLFSIIFSNYFVIFLDDQIEGEKIENCCYKAVENYESQYSEIISIGISNLYNDYQNIKSAFDEARKVVDHKLFPMINSVARPDDGSLNEYKPQVIEAMDFIARNYHQKNLTIKMVADHLYVSPSYLMHLFKDNISKTFNECLTEYRMIIAKKMLTSGKYKIYEIADKIGYSDARYFSQLFKKREGISPSDYNEN